MIKCLVSLMQQTLVTVFYLNN